MKIVILIVLACIAIVGAADETEDEPQTITKEVGLDITLCHPGDKATIHVVPIPENDHRVQGWFVTTNSTLTLNDLSMLPDGTNRLEIQTICRGQTSEVSVATLNIQRPPPKPKVRRRRLHVANMPYPPMPPGLVLPLPDGTNKYSSYQEYRKRLDDAMNFGRRRSQ